MVNNILLKMNFKKPKLNYFNMQKGKFLLLVYV